MQWSGERPGMCGRSVCGPSWAGAIQGKSRKEEMMASPNPASALSCPTPDNSEKGTSLPQGQSWHPGSEALPDNFLYGAFPSLQGLHLPLLHWPLPSRMCSWFLLREAERTEEGEKNLFERLFLSKLSPFFTPHPWPTFLTEIIFTYCFHCLSSDDVSAHSSLASPPPAPTPPRWERLLPKLSTTSLLRQQQACALGSSFSLASWLWGPAPRLSSCLWASSLSTSMAGSPSQVQPWTRVLFCLPPVMMNISPLCHRHWPPKLNSASHLPAQPCPARRAAHLILWPRQDTIVYKLPGPESHGRGLSPTSVSPSTSDHCPDLPLASQITHISSPSIHPQYHDSCLNSWISSPH